MELSKWRIISYARRIQDKQGRLRQMSNPNLQKIWVCPYRSLLCKKTKRDADREIHPRVYCTGSNVSVAAGIRLLNPVTRKEEVGRRAGIRQAVKRITWTRCRWVSWRLTISMRTMTSRIGDSRRIGGSFGSSTGQDALISIMSLQHWVACLSLRLLTRRE